LVYTVCPAAERVKAGESLTLQVAEKHEGT